MNSRGIRVCEQDTFRQVGINEYRTGPGIEWHKDKPKFGIIVRVSLLAAAIVRFRMEREGNWLLK